MNTRIRSIADWLGIAASTACGVHCILIPSLLVAGMVIPIPFLADDTFHLAMMWMIVPAAVVAFGIGCWRHKDRWVLLLGLVGLCGMVLSISVVHDVAGETGERIVTVISAGVLVMAHIRNYRICQSSDCAH